MQDHAKKLRLYYELSKYLENRPTRAVIFMPRNRRPPSTAAAGIRVEADYRSEKMGYKIREAQLKKIPYMLVVGDKEMEDGTVAVRARKEEKGGAMTVDAFLEAIRAEIDSKER